jgi:hypothetical protein
MDVSSLVHPWIVQWNYSVWGQLRLITLLYFKQCMAKQIFHCITNPWIKQYHMNYQMVKGTNDSLYWLAKSSMKIKKKLDQQKALSPSCQQR